MRKVRGYLTDDGTFFPDLASAELYEASEALKSTAERNGFAPNSVLSICIKFPDEIMRFVYAYHTQKPTAPRNDAEIAASVTKRAEDNRTANEVLRESLRRTFKNDNRTEEVTEAVQQQPSRSDEPMSNLRRRLIAETKRDISESDGFGGGGDDASSVRGGEDMAVDAQTRFAETLRRRREESLWGDAMEENSERYEQER